MNAQRHQQRWIVRRGGVDHGPFSMPELVELARKGELERDHVVTEPGSARERKVADWPELLALLVHWEKERARSAEQEAARRARVRATRLDTLKVWAIGAAVAAFVLGLGYRVYLQGAALDPAVAAVLAGTVLGVAWLVGRSQREATALPIQPWTFERGERAGWLGGLVVLAAGAPLLATAPWIAGLEPASFGDEVTQARVAADIARSGLSHLWVESYLAGYPFGLHEPGLGPLLLAALVWLGVSPLGATHTLGLLALIATPLAFYGAGLRLGARPLYATAGALVVAWVAPNTPLVGGYEAFLSAGLLTRALALPVCILASAEIAHAGARWTAPLLAVIAWLLHPPLALAAAIVTTLACVAAGRRETLWACLRSAAAASAVAIAVYGPGQLVLSIPFGSPSELAWREVGFPLTRLGPWLLEGGLFDTHRMPGSTYLVGLAALALLLQLRNPAARAALVAACAALAIPLLGPVLEGLGGAAPTIAAFAQPLHAIALVPIAGGGLLCVALEESAPRIEHALADHGGSVQRIVELAAGAMLVAGLLVALPSRVEVARASAERLAARTESPCGPLTPEGYDRDEVHGWLRSLAGGRLWYASTSMSALECASVDALQLSSAVPIAVTTGAGSHVGVLWSAFGRLEPARGGSVQRAEALGVRFILESDGAEPPDGWRVEQSRGPVRIFRHDQPTTLVGAGCIRERWSGSSDALRERLLETLARPEGADRLLSPTRLIALEVSSGPVIEESVVDDCDATSARVREVLREPGVLEADVETRTPVDVVLRATAFPSWSLLVNAMPATGLRQLAPGFLAVRIPPGRHRVVARAGALEHHGWAILASLLIAVLAATTRRAWFVRDRS